MFFVVEGHLQQLTQRELQKGKFQIKWNTFEVNSKRELKHKNDYLLNHIKRESYFGVQELFTGMVRDFSILSVDFSTLFKLSRRDFLQVLKKSPADYVKK